MNIDIGDVYERAREAAKVTVAGSPGTTYGLEDVMSPSQWANVASSAFVSLIPVHGTLNGCVEALQDRKVSAADVEKVDGPPPEGTAVTQEDMRIARSWLADSLFANVDEDGRQAMVDRDAGDQDWRGDAGRLTSIVLALVVISGAAADR